MEHRFITAKCVHYFDPLAYHDGVGKQNKFIRKAVWNRSGEKKLFYEVKGRCGSSLYQSSHPSTREPYEVETISLDDYCEQERLFDEVDLIIIDVQGAEEQVIRGATKILKTVPFVLCEALTIATYSCGPTRQNILKLMSQQGFQTVLERSDIHKPSSGASDILFSRKGSDVRRRNHPSA